MFRYLVSGIWYLVSYIRHTRNTDFVAQEGILLAMTCFIASVLQLTSRSSFEGEHRNGGNSSVLDGVFFCLAQVR